MAEKKDTEVPHVLRVEPGGRIAFIGASWHADMVGEAREGFGAEMAARGVEPERIHDVRVPGAFEIPLMAKRLARTRQYCAIVAAGFVVDGGIYRHDFVASAVIDGLMRVQLDTDVPVFSCVLTPHHFHESEDHVAFFRAHMRGKGAEVARACMDILRHRDLPFAI